MRPGEAGRSVSVATYGDDGRGGGSVVLCSLARVNVPSQCSNTFFSRRVKTQQKAQLGFWADFYQPAGRMTWLLVLLIIRPHAALAENICDLSFCSCQDTVAQCEGNNQEEIVLSPRSLPHGVTSLTLSKLRSLHVKTNTFKEQVELMTLIWENISNIRLDSFIFSETEYDGFLRTFEMNNVINLDLLEDTFRQGF